MEKVSTTITAILLIGIGATISLTGFTILLTKEQQSA